MAKAAKPFTSKGKGGKGGGKGSGMPKKPC
jgi:hypothetical protein